MFSKLQKRRQQENWQRMEAKNSQNITNKIMDTKTKKIK